MSAEHCEHCDLPRDVCAHSVPAYLRNGLSDRPVADGPTIIATQNGPCVGCPDRIVADQSTITHTEDGWAHEHCTDRPAGPPPTDASIFDGI